VSDAAPSTGPSTGPGTIALVTGASSGIGAATARLLAAGGTTVALVARRADRLEEVAEDCRLTAPRSRAWPADLGDTDHAAQLALRIWDELGPLDVVVNNAAIPMRRPAQRLTMAEVERTMTVNFYSPVAITLALLPRMLERGSGTIVNVSSMGGRLGITAEAAYSASKFALAGWSESLAVDLFGTGVSVKLVLPGAFDTEIWDQPDNDTAPYSGPLAPPEEGAVGIVESITSDRFEHYVPDMKAVVEMKTKDIDGFMAGMRAMADSVQDDPS
jgi:short-subunit dehydrogenase